MFKWNHKWVIGVVCLALLFGCQSDNSDDSTMQRQSVSDELEPLYDEVMTIHDEVMPEMKTLTQLQEQMSVKLDTLRQQTPIDHDALQQANRVLGNLNRAEDAMWSWMHDFSKLDSVPETDHERFLLMEKSSALSMKELMLSSIASAKTYLNENPISGE